MDSINLINSYKIKNISNQITIQIESAVAIGVIKYLNELVILGNNGKIIESNLYQIMCPKLEPEI